MNISMTSHAILTQEAMTAIYHTINTTKRDMSARGLATGNRGDAPGSENQGRATTHINWFPTP